jgi:hypothetical protein
LQSDKTSVQRSTLHDSSFDLRRVRKPKSEAPVMKKANDPEAVRRARIRQLFTACHPEEATEDDVFLFFKWLQQRYPEMLPKGKYASDS